jgi:hypothetical protein
MLQPANLPIRADRWVSCVRTIAFVGFDFTGANFRMEVRDYPDQTGTARIALAKVTSEVQGIRLAYAGSDTVLNHITAGRLRAVPTDMEPTDTVALSQLRIRIDKANIQALPFPSERGDPVDFAYDLHITPSGGDEDVWAYGLFTVVAGVTQ